MSIRQLLVNSGVGSGGAYRRPHLTLANSCPAKFIKRDPQEPGLLLIEPKLSLFCNAFPSCPPRATPPEATRATLWTLHKLRTYKCISFSGVLRQNFRRLEQDLDAPPSQHTSQQGYHTVFSTHWALHLPSALPPWLQPLRQPLVRLIGSPPVSCLGH